MSIESRSSQYSGTFGNWQIEKLLGTGSGGRTAVFSICRNNGNWQEYSAMKVISLIEERGRVQDLPEFRQNEYSTAVRELRLQADREVRLMDQLRGKTNIVDYLDHRFVPWRNETHFGLDLLIRMEQLTDLRSQLQQGVHFAPAQIRRIGEDLCRALTICHSKNILHRDIKPENIFFNADGDYKLGDFGIARIMSDSPVHRASTGIGTAAYAAPEQNSGNYDHRVDIYSLGLVLYELANGNRLPFASTSYITEQNIQSRLAGAPCPPPCDTVHTDPVLTGIILKACAFRPEDRYQSAAEMLAALCQPISSVPQHTGTGADPYATTPVGTGPYQTIPANSGTDTYSTTPAIPDTNVTPQEQTRTQNKAVLPLILAAIALLAAAIFLLTQHRHSWTGANCSAPRTCEDCGETDGLPLGHDWMDADCANPQVCAVCGETQGSALGHNWTEATCLEPRHCATCGKTEGAALGHNWIDATCLEPRHCAICGKSEGSVREHSWTEANCAEPMTCSLCGKTQGSALGHSWTEATFRAPMTCSRCFQTSGTAIPTDSIDMEDEVLSIRERYNYIMTLRQNNRCRVAVLREKVTAYYDQSGELLCVEVMAGAEGLDSYSQSYNRAYYYQNGELIFAFIFNVDSHRLYFHEEMLIRWLYRPNDYTTKGEKIYEFTFTDDYLMWEQLAVSEGTSFLP